MISVCIATYNGEKYVCEQLESILKQIGNDDEVIISDDGSTDETLNIIKGFIEKEQKTIKLIEGPRKGVIKNFENAIKNAQGDIIFLSDQDDIWEDNKVETMVDAFRKSNDYYVVVHDATVVDSNGEKIMDSFFATRNSKKGLIKNLIKNSYIGCCMAFKCEIKEKILPFPDGIEMHDWWIGLVSEMKYKSYFIDEKLIRYRRHGDNVSSLHHHPLKKMLGNRLTFIKELVKL